MGDWCDTVADSFDLPRPPRVTREEAARHVAPLVLSFMSESRRLVNQRMKRELRVRLEHKTPQVMLAALVADLAPRELKQQLALPLQP